MENTSEVILRQLDGLRPGVLLVDPPDPALLPHIPAGYFVSLNHARWQSMQLVGGWMGQFGLDQALAQKVDHVIVWMPKARKELEMSIAWALAQVNPGARLWLVGAKRSGTEAAGKALKQRFPGGAKRDSARHCQLWEYRVAPAESAFDADTWVRMRHLAVPMPEGEDSTLTITIADLPGIFSEGRLDEGTRRLLAAVDVQPTAPVLDFACGAGVVGACLLARWPELEVDFLDVQWQALVATRRTLAASGMNGHIRVGNGLEGVDRRYGTIITNPPFHTGVKTDLAITRRFVTRARSHLASGGTLWLVANTFLPYRELLAEHFPRVEIVSEDSRFRVYRARIV